jgi:hypothetical protein
MPVSSAILVRNSATCSVAMRFTSALDRRLSRQRPTKSLMRSMGNPRSRARLMKRSVCTSASPYTR